MMIKTGSLLTEQERLIARYKLAGSGIYCVAWSPDSTLLAVDADDNSVRVITTDCNDISRLVGHTSDIKDIAFSPNGKCLATASADGTIRLWDSNTGTELHCLTGHEECVNAIAFLNGGDRLVSGADDSSIRLWDTHAGTGIALDAKFYAAPDYIAVSPSGNYFASVAGDEPVIRLWDSEKGLEVTRFIGHKGRIWTITFSADGRHLLSASSDHTIRLWNAETGNELTQFSTQPAEVRSISASPNGRHFAVSMDDYTVRLWCCDQQAEIAKISPHEREISKIAFSPDGQRLVTISWDESLCLWDTSDLMQAPTVGDSTHDLAKLWLARQTATLGRSCVQIDNTKRYTHQMQAEIEPNQLRVIWPEQIGGNASAVAFSKDGKVLFYHMDYYIHALHIGTGNVLWRECFLVDSNIELSPNGAQLAFGGGKGCIYFLDSATGKERFSLTAHTYSTHALALSPDGRYFASGSFDRTLFLFDLTTNKELARFSIEANATINRVAFTPNSQRIAGLSNRGTIYLWECPSGKQIMTLPNPSFRGWDVPFSFDERNIITSMENGNIVFLDAESGAEQRLFIGHTDRVHCLAFSPDGLRMATGCGENDRSIRIWDVATGTELQRLHFPEAACIYLAWAPDDSFLVAGLQGQTVRIFTTTTSKMNSAAISPTSTPLAPANQPNRLPSLVPPYIPAVWAGLQQLGIAAPLSMLCDLQALLSGTTPETLQPLSSCPGLFALQNLCWPKPAHTGLIALLLNEWPGGPEWQAPANTSNEDLRLALIETLANGGTCQPTPPTPPIAWLNAMLENVDEHLLTLLNAIGPQAVAADPGLPLRMLVQAPQFPQFTPDQRQLLGMRVTPLKEGQANHNGCGHDRAGFITHGTITTLVPSQWTYPRHLFHWRHRNGGLLYRPHNGHEPPQLRPLVIVLDTSPACWGVIEAFTRPIAYALAEALASQHRPTILMTTGDNQAYYLTLPAERLQLLTHRSQHAGDISTTLAKAQSLRCELADGSIEPAILLLTHCWWGADLVKAAHQPGLRTLFVQYPGTNIRPPFAQQCERWETLCHNQFFAITGALGRLIG